MKPILKGKALDAFNIINDGINEINNNHLFAFSAQASFFVIISAVPLIMLMITLLQAYLPISKADLLQVMYDFLPAEFVELSNGVIDEIYSQISVSITAVTAIALLWSASRGIKSISLGMQAIYDTPKKRGYFLSVLFSLIYTVVLIAMVFACAVILVFGKYLITLIYEAFPNLPDIFSLLYSLRMMIFFVVLTLLFTTAYKFLSADKYKLRRHIPGAAFASLGWIVFSWAYSIYIANFSNISYIYGSLAALILLMLWLYFCMTILLLGAQINVWISEKRFNSRIKALFKKQPHK